jgi:hypothetical protein
VNQRYPRSVDKAEDDAFPLEDESTVFRKATFCKSSCFRAAISMVGGTDNIIDFTCQSNEVHCGEGTIPSIKISIRFRKTEQHTFPFSIRKNIVWLFSSTERFVSLFVAIAWGGTAESTRMHPLFDMIARRRRSNNTGSKAKMIGYAATTRPMRLVILLLINSTVPRVTAVARFIPLNKVFHQLNTICHKDP